MIVPGESKKVETNDKTNSKLTESFKEVIHYINLIQLQYIKEFYFNSPRNICQKRRERRWKSILYVRAYFIYTKF